MWRFGKNKQEILPILLICLIALFYLLNLRGGQDWGDDFALYILHAQNLVQGKAYSVTGYLFNPDLPDLSPKAYPPVFPLLLTSFVAIFGINLAALKLVGLGCFVGFLFLFAYLAKRAEIPQPARLVLIASLGLHPLFWSMTDRILSDLPFLLICTLALEYMQGLASRTRNRIEDGLLTGLLIYLAYGTRSIGLVLVPVLLLSELLIKRKISLQVVVAIFCALALIGIQAILIPETGSYLNTIMLPLKEYFNRFSDFSRFYYDSISHLFPFHDALLRHLLFNGALVFAVVGYLHQLQRGWSVYHVFVPAYLAAILLWPAYQGMRFLIPILPFFLLFAYHGAFFSLGSLRISRSLQILCLAIFCLVFGLSYRDGYKIPAFQRVDAISSGVTQQLFSFLRNQVAADAIIVFNKPRALSLFSGRKSVMIAIPGERTPVETQLARFGADYLVLTADDQADLEEWRKYLDGLPAPIPMVYQNPRFWVYQLQAAR